MKVVNLKKPAVGCKCSREVGMSPSGHKITCPSTAIITVAGETEQNFCKKHFEEFQQVLEVRMNA